MPGVSPLTIKIMFACFYAANPADHVGESWDSHAGLIARDWLENKGLIDPDDKATERGRAWVNDICGGSDD